MVEPEYLWIHETDITEQLHDQTILNFAQPLLQNHDVLPNTSLPITRARAQSFVCLTCILLPPYPPPSPEGLLTPLPNPAGYLVAILT